LFSWETPWEVSDALGGVTDTVKLLAASWRKAENNAAWRIAT
jgi:hypothetical protein